ncbi:MAG: hypothetical protein J7K00_05400 [Candidatus Diapherotrites archaeon]|nr:hypothetical protein [Candidatus Diapherotrites archaeon]
MKFPAEQNKYCPYCNTQTKQTIKLGGGKVSKASTKMRFGVRKRARKEKGYGAINVRGKAANTKKLARGYQLKLTCSVCKKSHMIKLAQGKRLKKKPELIK